MKLLALALTAFLANTCLAQTSTASPPEDALAPDQPRLELAVAGHHFKWRTEDSERGSPGMTATLYFLKTGAVTTETSTGRYDKGTWTAEGSRLCFRWQASASGCNDVRINGETLWLMHGNGKWSSMTLIRDRREPSRVG